MWRFQVGQEVWEAVVPALPLCLCLGALQTDQPGGGSWVETRDFCREDVRTRIQTLQHGAEGVGSFPL